jgi:hypothetical protein
MIHGREYFFVCDDFFSMLSKAQKIIINKNHKKMMAKKQMEQRYLHRAQIYE